MGSASLRSITHNFSPLIAALYGMGNDVNIDSIVQVALLGQVPSTLRFIYAKLEGRVFTFDAVFTTDASEEHVAAIDEALTEICSHFDSSINVVNSFLLDSETPWKIGDCSNLLYLRYGEYIAI